MSILFVVLVTKLKKKTRESQLGNFWSKTCQKLQSGKTKVLYCCKDTSADKLIRKHAAKTPGYKTYVVVPVDMDKAHNSLLDTVASSLKGSINRSTLETADNYEVVVNQ